MLPRLVLFAILLAPCVAAPPPFATELRPLMEKTCFECHGEKKQKGGVEFASITSEGAFIQKPRLLRSAIEQLELREMPPDDDDLPAPERARLVAGLRQTLALLDSDLPALRDPGPSLIRRLSRSEYNNALRDLFGYEFDAVKAAGIPEDSTGRAFDNIAAALLIPPAMLEKYFSAADALLTELWPEKDAVRKDDWSAKERAKKAKAAADRLGPPADAKAARQFLASFLRRAWRRPVLPAEVERFAKIWDASAKDGDFAAALRRSLKPILVSPNFLFRIESDATAAPAHATLDSGQAAPSQLAASAARISDLELASRLSFFVWSSIPDDALLALAEKGELSKPDVLETQVRRLLADPRARALADNFLTKWLELDKLAAARPSTEFFPAFNDKLKSAMRAEVETFCNKLREDDRPILDLLAADYTYANEDLAKFYGFPGITGKEPQRVALRPEQHRGGILGMAGILALTSHSSRTSPTLRGKYVLNVVFGTPPQPPPANVSQIDESKKRNGKDPRSFREKLALHAEDPTCAGCHKKLDPLGFGLDNFDAIGAWRPPGPELDTRAELPGGRKFNGADELKAIVWEKRDLFLRNLIGQTLSYALGRELEYYDEGHITRIKADLEKNGGKFSSLILAVTKSFPFQNRRNAVPNVPKQGG
jgi:hypothetical protein